MKIKHAVSQALPLALLGLAAAALGPSIAQAQPATPRLQPGPAVTDPEDIVAINDRWVIASSIGHQGLYLIDTVSHQPAKIDFSEVAVEPDKATYRDCPGPVDFAKLSALGLDYYKEAGKLLVVNHGGRTAIEVFRLDDQGVKAPKLTWIGCAVAPKNTFVDSVAGINANDMIVTSLLTGSIDSSTGKLLAAQAVGAVYRWTPATGFRTLPGTATFSGPNGVIADRDGSRIFISLYGAKQVVRLTRTGGSYAMRRVSVAYQPDNLRWAADGRHLLVGGQVGQMKTVLACAKAITDAACKGVGAAVDILNSETMEVSSLLLPGVHGGWGVGTVATPIGRDYWLGSFHAKRIVILPRQ